MPADGPDTHALLSALLGRFRARAAGCWRVADGGSRLDLVAFAAAPDLAAGVARDFAEATRSVPLTVDGLGIVGAARTGAPAVSRAAELPADSGSGLWLRRFGAARSVAVPLPGPDGSVARVVALALADAPPSDDEVAAAIRAAAGGRPDERV